MNEDRARMTVLQFLHVVKLGLMAHIPDGTQDNARSDGQE